MYHLLIGLGLEFARDSITYLKYNDMKAATNIDKQEVKELQKEQELKKDEIISLDNLQETLPIEADESFLNESDTFVEPYIETTNFAELLPEEEVVKPKEENVVPAKTEESLKVEVIKTEDKILEEKKSEEGPKFLDNIKDKLISVSDKKDPSTTTAEEVSRPTFLENIKDKLLTSEKVDTETDDKDTKDTDGNKGEDKDKKVEEKKEYVVEIKKPEEDNVKDNNKKKEESEKKKKEESKIIETLKNKVAETTNSVKDGLNNIDTSGMLGTIKDKSLEAGSIIKDKSLEASTTIQEKAKEASTTIQEKAKDTGDKIKSISFKDRIKNMFSKDNEEIRALPILGTLNDAELNQALKENYISEYKEILNREAYEDIKNITYQEDEEYQKFLDEKDISKLIEPERVAVPNVIPRAKELISYDQHVPIDLIEDRSFQNRHIPKIMKRIDDEEVLEKIIEYGMIDEFRAYLDALRNANLTMNNQYTLLTYAIKHKQYKIMAYLLHIGADVNKKDDRLDTPIMLAIKNKDSEAIRFLTEAGANLDVEDVFGRTPLIYCIEKNYQDIALYLIDNGADINITNPIGEGTLSMAIRYGRNLIRERLLDELLKQREQTKNEKK